MWWMLACNRSPTGRPPEPPPVDHTAVPIDPHTGVPTLDHTEVFVPVDTAAGDGVPEPNECGNPSGVDPNLVDPTAWVADFELYVSEDGIGGGYAEELGAPSFFRISAWNDVSVVVDPYEGLDDCVVYTTRDVIGASERTTGGTSTYTIVGREFSLDGAWFDDYGVYGYWYPYIDLRGVDPPLSAPEMWGATLGISTTGADVQPFDLPDAVRFSSGPLLVTSPPDSYPDPYTRRDVVLRWTPSPEQDAPLQVSLQFTRPDDEPRSAVTLVLCHVEDDGEWTPPQEVWDYFPTFPLKVSLNTQRREDCGFPIGDGTEFVRMSTFLVDQRSIWVVEP